jgi:hypothetical protein
MRTLITLTVLVAALGCDPRHGLAPDEDSCLHCHSGIEAVHAPHIPAGQCVVCHGGDREGFTEEEAHIAAPADWADIRGPGLPPAPDGFIKDFAPDQLDALDPAYVRFINPGDIRAVGETCGACHANKVETMPNSVMVTNAGHYFPTLYLAGLQDDQLAEYGSFPATDPNCDESVPGAVCGVETLVPPPAEEIQAAIDANDADAIEAIAYDHYLAKNCNTCHQAGYPRNNSPGLYRSTGCTSCHMLYTNLGVYEGGDPTIPRGTPTHAARHELTKAIPTEQCAHCHFQGGRIGLLYQGIREGGFGASSAGPDARPIPETLYGHAPGYYFDDEDTTNDFDETPPDVHFEAGMHCADCHVGSDVHGDGRLYSSSKLQVDIRCEDCHGTILRPATPDAVGRFRTSGGRPLPQLSQREDGSIILTGIVDGAEHPVAQPASLLAPGGGGSTEMHRAMAQDENGWSHTDSLTCDSCHTSYNQFCIGCHVSYDLRLSQIDYQTGLVTPGLTRGSRDMFSLDHLLLGTGVDGRVQTVHPSQQVDMAVFGATSFGTGDGEVLVGEVLDDGEGGTKVVGKFRAGPGGPNNGFVPFFQHTTSRGARDCSACHRRDDSDAELQRVRGVYGFGTGEFMLPTPDGGEVDGLRFLDDDGNETTDWTHPGTGSVDAERRGRALGVNLSEEP